MSEYRTTAGERPPLSHRDRKTRRLRTVGLVAMIAGVVIAGGFLIRTNRYVLASGYVTAEDYAEVRPPAPGTISEIIVLSGKEVKSGDVLVQLEDSVEEALRGEAISLMRKVQAEISRREAEIADEKRRRKQEMSIADLKHKHASAKVKLTQGLYEEGLASGSALEDARLSEKLTRAELDTLRTADQTLAEKELNVLRQELKARAETVACAEARLRSRRVRAPISGRVVRYDFVIGELVQPDSVLYEVFGGNKLILKLRVPERHATRVAPGNPYRARLASYQGARRVWFRGTVEVLRDVIEAEGQKTYRVAYCSFDPDHHRVPPGTTAEVQINIGTSNFWASLLGL